MSTVHIPASQWPDVCPPRIIEAAESWPSYYRDLLHERAAVLLEGDRWAWLRAWQCAYADVLGVAARDGVGLSPMPM